VKVLIGYAMRSGSTLLAHVLGGHSGVRAYGDLSSLAALPRLAGRGAGTVVVKPPDLVFLGTRRSPLRYFDRAIWLTRDPRDSYLSALESGYAYWFRRPGPYRHGIDVGLVDRWARIHHHVLSAPDRWHLVRYEDFTAEPRRTLRRLLAFLDLPEERLLPFRWRRRDWLRGGDYKIAATRDVTPRGVGRHRRMLNASQQAVFHERVGEQMRALGYADGAAAPACRPYNESIVR